MSKRKSLNEYVATRPNKLPRPYEIFEDGGQGSIPTTGSHYPVPVPEVQHHLNNGTTIPASRVGGSDAPVIQYPTTLMSFADGIKSDLFEIMSSGASILFPFSGTNPSESSTTRIQKHRDDADDIADLANGRQIPLSAKPNGFGSDVLSKPLRQMTKSEISMRCPSAYTEKENRMLSSVPALPKASNISKSIPTKAHSGTSRREATGAALGAPPAGVENAALPSGSSKSNNSSSENVPTKPSAGDTKPKYSGGMKVGDQISQAKLVGNAKLPTFCTTDDKILIIGSKAMVIATKSSSNLKIAEVTWIQSFCEIDSFSLSFEPGVGKAHGTMCGKLEVVYTPSSSGAPPASDEPSSDNSCRLFLQFGDINECTRILEQVQTRKQALLGGASAAPRTAIANKTSSVASTTAGPSSLNTVAKHNERSGSVGSTSSVAAKTTTLATTADRPVSIVAARISNAEPMVINQAGSSAVASSDLANAPVAMRCMVKPADTITSPAPTPQAQAPVSVSSQAIVQGGASLIKYKTMIKNGVPESAVQHKMKIDNVSAADQALVLSKVLVTVDEGASTSSASLPAGAPVPVIVPELSMHLQKYKIMIKNGVPESAVQHKMKIDNVSAADQALVLDQQNPSITCASISSPAAPAELPVHLKKYKMMLSNGVPAPAVQHKMALDQVSAADQALVTGCGATAPAAASSSAAPAAPAELPAHLKKYKMMLKNGVPEAAVQHKMAADNVPAADQALVVPKANAAGTATASVKETIPEEFVKYQKMLKAGVPAPSVKHKLAVDGVPEKFHKLILGETGASATKTPAKAPSSKMLSLHWDVIHEDQLGQNTMWSGLDSPTPTPSKLTASAMKSSTKKRRRASTGGLAYLKDDEMDKLASMFSKKQPQPKAALDKGKGEEKGSKKATNKLQVIDIARSTNISIGLTSFKGRSLTVDQVVRALDSVDLIVLADTDLLLRIKDMLPTDAEMKSFSRIKAPKNDNDSNIATSDALPVGAGLTNTSEVFLWHLCNIKDLKKKINGLLFLSQFDSRIRESLDSLRTLGSASSAIKDSVGLKEVMKSVLAIGNAMNTGASAAPVHNTRSSGAQPIKAFKLNSLLKLTQTKSTDGTATVMDYLLQLLLERTTTSTEGEADVASAAVENKSTKALSIDKELDCVHACCKLSLADLRKETRSVKTELQNLQDLHTSMSSANSTVASNITEEFGRKLTTVTELCVENEASLESCQQLCKDLCIYFSEDISSPQVIFDVLSTFIKHFVAIKTKLMAKAKANQRGRSNKPN